MNEKNQMTPESSWFDGRVKTLSLERHIDDRGMLLPIDLGLMPFTPKRIFTVSGVPPGISRGGHGHRKGQQLLICIQGKLHLSLRDNSNNIELLLTDDGPGVLVSHGIWCEQTYLEEKTVLQVLTSEPFDPDAYFHLESQA